VNNRNLNDFSVDLATTETIAAQMALQQTLLVAESGIHTRADVQRLTAAGARAILVGEALMRETDIGAKVRELGGQS
jgi:indole-3-glycerol phosphate synthase